MINLATLETGSLLSDSTPLSFRENLSKFSLINFVKFQWLGVSLHETNVWLR